MLSNVRRDALHAIKHIVDTNSLDVGHILPADIESMTKSELQSLATAHSVPFDCRTSVSDLRGLLLNHVQKSCIR